MTTIKTFEQSGSNLWHDKGNNKDMKTMSMTFILVFIVDFEQNFCLGTASKYRF